MQVVNADKSPYTKNPVANMMPPTEGEYRPPYVFIQDCKLTWVVHQMQLRSKFRDQS